MFQKFTILHKIFRILLCKIKVRFEIFLYYIILFIYRWQAFLNSLIAKCSVVECVILKSIRSNNIKLSHKIKINYSM